MTTAEQARAQALWQKRQAGALSAAEARELARLKDRQRRESGSS